MSSVQAAPANPHDPIYHFEPPELLFGGGTVRGTSGDDVVHISKADGLAGLLGMLEVSINGKTQLMTQQQLEHTKFKLGDGNDTLLVDDDVTANIEADGGKGNDILIGGSGNDTLRGGKGDDIILGRGGDDTLRGGKGNDIVLGGCGNDEIKGKRGSDWLFGGSGHDAIRGGRGQDDLRGGCGGDWLKGGHGDDHIRGGRGQDEVKHDWKDLLPPPPHVVLGRIAQALFG
jgi:Ca2+-binding RTX toxin-like protein